MRTRPTGVLRWPLALVISISSVAHAETWTLAQAVDYTLSENRNLRASERTVDSARALVDVARAGRVPQLELRYDFLGSNNPLDAFATRLNTRKVTAEDFDPDNLNDPDTSTLFGAGVVLRYSVYNGGRTDAEIDRALRGEEAATLNHRRSAREAAFQTIRSYHAAQAAESALTIATDAEQAASRHARTTRQLVREDRTVKSDQLTAEVNLAAFKSLREQTVTHRKLAYNQLKVSMGMIQDQPLAVTGIEALTPAQALHPVTVYEQHALAHRSDLQALRAVLAAAEAAVRSARSASRPMVDVMADTTWYEDNPLVDENSWRVMGAVTYELYGGGRTRAQVAAAQARAESLRDREAFLKQAILGEVRAAYDQVHDALARLEIAKGNVSTAQRNVHLVDERYGQGRTILIDLLQAERALVEARNEELASIQSLATSLAALGLADGSLNPAQPPTFHSIARP